jgi:hypothetical protein
VDQLRHLCGREFLLRVRRVVREELLRPLLSQDIYWLQVLTYAMPLHLLFL